MTDIVVPQWGLTTDEATLNTWLKTVGDHVEVGESIAELETDKTTADLDSPATEPPRVQWRLGSPGWTVSRPVF